MVALVVGGGGQCEGMSSIWAGFTVTTYGAWGTYIMPEAVTCRYFMPEATMHTYFMPGCSLIEVQNSNYYLTARFSDCRLIF